MRPKRWGSAIEEQATSFVSIIYTSANADAYESYIKTGANISATQEDFEAAYKPYSDKLLPLVTQECFEKLIAVALPIFADELAARGNAISADKITVEKSENGPLVYKYTAQVTAEKHASLEASGILTFVEKDGKYLINSVKRTDSKVFAVLTNG